jgi:hypothetical protein
MIYKFIKERIIGIGREPRQGIIGIIIAIKWLGIRRWVECSTVRKTITDEAEIYEWKSGN